MLVGCGALSLVCFSSSTARGQGTDPTLPIPQAPVVAAPSIDSGPLNALTSPIQAVQATQSARVPLAHERSTVIEHHPHPEERDHPAMKPYWNNGLFMQSDDKGIVFHMGGTAQFDAAWFQAPKSLDAGVKNPISDGATPRRIRFRADGTLWDDFDFFSEIEFINGFSPPGNVVAPSTVALVPSVTEVWITMKHIPYLGNFRFGNQKEPLGLEHLNSDRFLEFMERSFLQDLTYVSSFNNGFSPGMTFFRNYAEGRIYSAAGVYENINDPFAFATGDGQYAATGRVAALPIWKDGGKTFWEVGGAMSHRDTVSDGYQSRIRGLIRSVPGPFLPVYADTTLLSSQDNDVYALETIFGHERFTCQAEYMASIAHDVTTAGGTSAGDLLFSGWYVQALFFLTDDQRTFNQTTYTANRVVPKNNFSWKNCTGGAWEVGARYSYINLNDGPVVGGVLSDVVIGLTWYLNPMARFYFNYEYLDRSQVSNPFTAGIQHAFGTRFALDF